MIRIIRVNEAICPVCEKPAVGGATHPKCQTRYTLDGLTSFFRYDGPVRKAVKAIKYRFVSDMASEFVALIPEDSLFALVTLLHAKPLSSLLVPIPLHPARARYRGFNQAEKLGALLARRLNIPTRTDILRRTRETAPQVEMKRRTDRLKNMEGVFAMMQGFDKILIDQKIVKTSKLNVLLFDDVFTTGATMRNAANILKRAGAKYVWAVTMAR